MSSRYFVQDRIITVGRELLKRPLEPRYVGRKTMSAPAEGYGSVHNKEQSELVAKAITL